MAFKKNSPGCNEARKMGMGGCCCGCSCDGGDWTDNFSGSFDGCYLESTNANDSTPLIGAGVSPAWSIVSGKAQCPDSQGNVSSGRSILRVHCPVTLTNLILTLKANIYDDGGDNFGPSSQLRMEMRDPLKSTVAPSNPFGVVQIQASFDAVNPGNAKYYFITSNDSGSSSFIDTFSQAPVSGDEIKVVVTDISSGAGSFTAAFYVNGIMLGSRTMNSWATFLGLSDPACWGVFPTPRSGAFGYKLECDGNSYTGGTPFLDTNEIVAFDNFSLTITN